MFSELFITQIRIRQEKMTRETGYFTSLPVVKNLQSLGLSHRVTFIVGENGTGKSTLLEAIAVNYGFNPEGGTKNFNFSSLDTHSALYKCITVTKGVKRPEDGFFLRAESFYNFASEVDRLDKIGKVPLLPSYGGKSLHGQSHGESFLSLALNRFSGNGLYILDEPEAALSPSSQLTLLCRINQLVEKGSQFIISTHSPILMAYPNADIYKITKDGIRLTPYTETDHYIITKQFLDSPRRMMKYMFN